MYIIVSDSYFHVHVMYMDLDIYMNCPTIDASVFFFFLPIYTPWIFI